MRIRTIKPEFWGDEKLSRMPTETRLLYIALWSIADDFGRLLDSVPMIVGIMHPFASDDEVAKHSRDTRESLARLSDSGRIVRGVTASGQQIIQIVRWDHQKVDKPSRRTALPEIVMSSGVGDSRESLAKHSRDPRENLAKVSRSDLVPRTLDLEEPPPPRARVREDDFREFFADPRVAAFFAFVPESTHDAWRATLAMWLQGEDWGAAPRPTPSQVAAGLSGAVTAHDGGPLGDQFVRGCIRRAMSGEEASAERRRDARSGAQIPAAHRSRALELYAVIKREMLSLLSGPQFDHETAKAIAEGRVDARDVDEIRAMMPLREIGMARSDAEGERLAIERYQASLGKPKLAVIA